MGKKYRHACEKSIKQHMQWKHNKNAMENKKLDKKKLFILEVLFRKQKKIPIINVKTNKFDLLWQFKSI